MKAVIGPMTRKGPVSGTPPAYSAVHGWVQDLRGRDAMKKAEALACLEYYGLPPSPHALVVAVRRGAVPLSTALVS